MTDSPIYRTKTGFHLKLTILFIVSALAAFVYKSYQSFEENNRQAAQNRGQQNEEKMPVVIAEETVAENNIYEAELVPEQIDAADIAPAENIERQNEEEMPVVIAEEPVPVQLDATAISPAENTELRTENMVRQNEEALMQALTADAKARAERRREYIQSHRSPIREKIEAIKKRQRKQRARKNHECIKGGAAYETGAATYSGRRSKAALLYIEGLKCFNSREYEEANEYWTKAAMLDPQNDDARLGLIRINSILKNKDN